ncbi:MAG: cytochrome P450 [Pyrinomonadaceae bacterium]|nr:cytochrome P450 [Pyrinomonadaceae bacterium]
MLKTISPPLPPSLKRDFIGGHLLSMRRDSIDFLTRTSKLGDITTASIGGQPTYFLNHPDLARDVFVTNHHKFHKGRGLQRIKRVLGEGLLTSEERFHLRQRRMAQPAFHRSRIAGYAATMVECAAKMSDEWRDKTAYNVSDEMMRLTLNVVGKTLFGANVESQAGNVGAAMTTMFDMFGFMMLPFFDLLEKTPLPFIRKFHQAREKLDAIIYEIINERRKSGVDNGDLLSMLLLAQDEDDGGMMTDKQVRDESLTIFLAGHETTANALTWTFYLLSQNPEIESQLHAELDRVLPDNQTPTFENYADLKFTENVVAESIRLFPPAWLLGRKAMEDYEVQNYIVPKGSLVLLSPYVMQHDARFWDDVNEFKPSRWDKLSVKEAGQKFIYFPFGGGVRRCIGEQFAWMEGVLLLATLARKWKLTLAPEQKIATQAVITLRPKYGMKMTATKR